MFFVFFFKIYFFKKFFKETRSASMNIFQKNLFSFEIICKSRIMLCFHNKSVHHSYKLQGKKDYLIKTGVFLLLVIICVPPMIKDS